MEELLFQPANRLMIFLVITKKLKVFGAERPLDIFRAHIMFGLEQLIPDIKRVAVEISGHPVCSTVQSMDFVRHLEKGIIRIGIYVFLQC